MNKLKNVFYAILTLSILKLNATTVDIPATVPFTTTGLTIAAGDCVTVSSRSKWAWGGSEVFADGIYNPNDLLNVPLLNGMDGQLIAKIDNASPFPIGSYAEFTATTSGTLYLGINDNELWDNSGVLTVDISITPACCTQPPGPVTWQSPDLGSSMEVTCQSPVTLSVASPNATSVRFYMSIPNLPLIDIGLGTLGQNNTFSLAYYLTFDPNYAPVTFIAVAQGTCGSSTSARQVFLDGPSCSTAPAGLKAFWADESLMDKAGGNNGSPENVTFVAGKVGGAAHFNGTTSEVLVPRSSSLDVGSGDGFTIEGWINPANLSSLNQWLAGWRAGASTYGAHIKISQAPGAGQGAGSICINLIDTSNNSHILSSVPVLVNNTFQHLAVTYDKTSGMAKIYVGGTVVAQGNLGTFTAQTGLGFVIAGAASSGNYGENSFAGDIDELSVYNRALTTQEVQDIIANCAGKCSPALTGFSAADVRGLWRAEGNTMDGFMGVFAEPDDISYVGGEKYLAFKFNGTTSGITVPAVERLDVGTQDGFSLSAWINPANLNNLNQWLVGWRNGASTYGSHIKLSQAPSSGQGAACVCINLIDIYGDAHVLSSAPVLLNNAFQLLVVTYDKITGRAKIYVNGVAVADSVIGVFTPQTTYDLIIGKEASEGNYGENGFSGAIDDLAIFLKALSETEVQQLFDAGSAGIN